MGKITRGRRKYHTASSTKNSGETTETIPPIPIPWTDLSKMLDRNPRLEFPSDNIFAGIDIPNNLLTQELDIRSVVVDDDTRSMVSKKSFKSDRPYKKKEKRLLRREAFLSKLNVARETEKAIRERKKRQKTVITGDMRPLADALPTCSIEVKKTRPPPKPRSIPKFKHRHQLSIEAMLKMEEAFANTELQN